jgi:hypothetical protein
MTLLPDIPSRSASTSTSGGPSTATARRTSSFAFDVLHFLVLVIVWARPPGSGHFLGNINLIALQEPVHDLAYTSIACAPPAWIAAWRLCLGLHPEEVALGRGGELEDEDTAICRSSG